MGVRHIFENGVYLISNYSTDRTFLFRDQSDLEFFRKKIEYYLSDVCEIIAIHLGAKEFNLVIRLNEIKEIRDVYLSKHACDNPDFFIPPVSYIFSQLMANLQVSYAKHYNWKYERKGSLFRARFERTIIKNGEDLLKLLSNLKEKHALKGDKSRFQSRKFERNLEGFGKRIRNESGKYKNQKSNLRGWFVKIPKTDLIPTFHRQFINLYRLNHPFGPNLN